MNGRSNRIGPMSKNSAHVPHYIPERVEFEIPDRITNASTKQRLSLADEWRGFVPRQGSMRAYSLLSVGTGC